MTTRKEAVAGSFYPRECEEIERYIDVFNDNLKTVDLGEKIDFIPKAIISPHAGYVYSGFTANIAFKSLHAEKIKRIVVMGPSHRVYLQGASVAMYDEYHTPCGNIKIDKEFSHRILDENECVQFIPDAHHEHSTETQMPFIKHYLTNRVKVVEIVYGQIIYEELSHIIDSFIDDPHTLLVISTDLSHFYEESEATGRDNLCLQAIHDLSVEGLDTGCEACGIIGIKALLSSAKKRHYRVKLLDYRTSADFNKDKTSVVGYTSAVLGHE